MGRGQKKRIERGSKKEKEAEEEERKEQDERMEVSPGGEEA